MKEADGALFRLVRAKAVGTDEFGEIGRVVGRRRLHPAHFVEDDGDARLGKLPGGFRPRKAAADDMDCIGHGGGLARVRAKGEGVGPPQRSGRQVTAAARSEEHTSELQSLMRTSYAVFCLKKKNNKSRTREQTL